MGARALLILIGACGRYGFAGLPSDASGQGADADAMVAQQKADALGPDAPPGDGAIAIDGAQGFGGYTLTDSTAPYTLLAGTVVPGFAPLADDENYATALPFAFPFFGIAYTAMTISMNGYVTFETPVTGTETQINDCPLDGTAPGATIAVFWDDLYANNTAPATGSLSYRADGVAPDRRFTVEWRDMDAFYPAGSNSFAQGVRVTHALVLHETGVIEMRYGPRTAPVSPNKDCGADRHRGCSATIGLEAPGSALFRNVQCGTSLGPGPGYTPIDAGRLFTFVPTP